MSTDQLRQALSQYLREVPKPAVEDELDEN